MFLKFISILSMTNFNSTSMYRYQNRNISAPFPICFPSSVTDVTEYILIYLHEIHFNICNVFVVYLHSLYCTSAAHM